MLNGRMLWTYSRAWDMVRYPACQELAQRAFRYIQSHFWDELYGGVYWAVTCRGEPSELEKRTYAQAFLIYSYAEYYRVFGSKEALDRARQVLSLLNRHMKYPQGGYADSAARDWLRDDWINFWVKNRNRCGQACSIPTCICLRPYTIWLRQRRSPGSAESAGRTGVFARYGCGSKAAPPEGGDGCVGSTFGS